MDCFLICLSCFLVFVVVTTVMKIKEISLKYVLTVLTILAIILGIIIFVDFKLQTRDTEVWSGKIVSVKHKEEYDEYIPPKTETYTTTDSQGKTVTETRTIPGYWEHHSAENHIKTTDGGTIKVEKTPSGKRFSDNFVNSDSELAEFYPLNSPTASVHTYENRLKASYSIFKIESADDEIYNKLPERPYKQNKDFTIDRLIGDFKNKKELNKHLNLINSRLNDTENINNKNKIKGYKQVNLIFVNFGNKSEDYGLALQNHWKNGAKNDFVVTFGTDKNGKIAWCHVFSWTEVEILKSDVREIVTKGDINNFKSVMNEVSKAIEDKFDRKQFSDFKYIQVEVTTLTKIIMFLIVGITCFIYIRKEG